MDNIIPFPTPVKTQEQLLFDFMNANEQPLNEETKELYGRLIIEEAKEVAEAAADLLKELTDLRYVVQGYINAGGDSEVAVDACCQHVEEHILNDLIEVFIDNLVDGDAFLRVHESNMSKLGEDGKPIRREDGKVLKGPNYKPADLLDLIQPYSELSTPV